MANHQYQIYLKNMPTSLPANLSIVGGQVTLTDSQGKIYFSNIPTPQVELILKGVKGTLIIPGAKYQFLLVAEDIYQKYVTKIIIGIIIGSILDFGIIKALLSKNFLVILAFSIISVVFYVIIMLVENKTGRFEGVHGTNDEGAGYFYGSVGAVFIAPFIYWIMAHRKLTRGGSVRSLKAVLGQINGKYSQ